MDKASIIKDAIEYIQHLQAGERHMEVEVSVLESAAGAKDNYGDGLSVEQVSSAQRKKVKRAVSITSMNDALLAAAVVVTSLPVEVLELRVPEVSEKLLVVSMTCSKKRGAMTKVCSALEELCPMVIIANITSISDCSMHTLFVKVPRRRPPQFISNSSSARCHPMVLFLLGLRALRCCWRRHT
ncbi:transcription factor BHLH6-like [Triticum aestivum]|uniref:transcription factor BHLH6-like n=1 Tax=Triticum aestivum TaxID=4565 RepID=UPI00098AD0D8|nr:transcription factor BHLH6-like [Triticum aestivum]